MIYIAFLMHASKVDAIRGHLPTVKRSLTARFAFFSLIIVSTLICPAADANTENTKAADTHDFLSIKFSRKNQLSTGLTWLRQKPELVFASNKKSKQKQKEKQKQSKTQQKAGNELPYSALGKLFFTKSTGEVASCSGGFAGSPSVVVTAGHCVMSDSGNWNSNFIFILGYGTGEQEIYAVQCVSVLAKWGELTGEELLPYDFAVLRTNRENPGSVLKISSKKPPETLTIIGYSDSHEKGTLMVEATTKVFSEDQSRLGFANNPFGPGNSGAPWIGYSTVYSVSSHNNLKTPGVMYGPRLSTEAMSLISYTNNGCD